MLACHPVFVQFGQTVTVIVERTRGGTGVYTKATVIVVYSATSTVEKTVLYVVVVVVLSEVCDWVGIDVVKELNCVELYVAGGVKRLEKVVHDGTMTSEKELLCSEFIVESIVSAGSEVVIGGLDEVTGTENEGGGGDRDGSPDEELP